MNQLLERVDAMEEDMAALQHDLVEAHERPDFAERLLSQSREGKRLESSP